jgi:ubiquinone/menaquinone biosynthesis C-methylase UbiE
MHAGSLETANWWARPRGAHTAGWLQNYRGSITKPHRGVIVEIVQGLSGVSTVLEVGSNNGPNLMRLAQALPHLEQLSGIDVSAEAVADGQRWAQELGLGERVEFVQGRIPEKTDNLPTGCVDVVLSCYTLAYIAPPDLDAALYEMGRLAKRAIVLAEPQRFEGPTEQTRAEMTGYAEWAHNYQAAAKWLGTWRGMRMSVVSVRPAVDRLEHVLVAVREET